ncbi:MAG TPA: nicotinate-nucleotide adenylyltransferase [Acidimicrobiales bacterium]|nr:nicotinate-nucleotide adenylyltransferase [Acidimicrobiales bacterium]
MTRLGVLGGTFDPVHVGHVAAAATARHDLELDRVLMVVANTPWQKTGTRAITPAEDRLAMVGAAVDGIEGLEVSRMEVDRGGPSYTADTLAELARAHPGAELFLIVGTDVADDLHTWVRVDEVARLATLAIVTRPGATPVRPEGWRVELVELPALDLSSTDLRRRVAEGRPIDGLVPPGAVRVIRERRLYAG